jgi:hypothetical protein
MAKEEKISQTLKTNILEKGKTSWRKSSLPQHYLHYVQRAAHWSADVIGLYDSFHDTIVSDDIHHEESHKVNDDFIICIKLFYFPSYHIRNNICKVFNIRFNNSSY